MLERELQLPRERLDARPKIARGERSELVEQGLDDGRVEDDHAHLEDEEEGHEPGDESVSGPLEDSEERGEEGRADDEANRPGLEEVGDEEAAGRLVEAVLLLENEGLVDGEGEGGKARDEEEREYKGDRLHNLEGSV